jgi:predicted RNA-binding Zn-ribbon protein involved in translation (DUF1610 family)
MVFLFGNKEYFDPLGYITMKCPACKTQRIFAVKQERKRLTVYFIPTFQFSSRQIVVCQHCGVTLQVDDDLKSTVAKNMITQKKLDSLIKTGKVDYLIEAAPKARTRKPRRMRCLKCSSLIDKNVKFCPECGNKI